MNLLPKNTDTSTVLELELAEKAGEYWNETSKHSAVQERLSAELVLHFSVRIKKQSVALRA